MSTNIENRLIWLNDKIVHVMDAKVNILSPTAQFGANVFEGIRCYWNQEAQQLYAFRLDDHYKRLKDSIKIFKMDNKYSVEELKQGLIDVVRANNYKEDIAVRQAVFIDGFGNWAAKGPVGMFIAPIPKARFYDDKNGISCCISTWERISDKNLSPKAKVGANYINSRMAQLEALQNGYDSAILLNVNGKIAEGPGSCLFIVRNGALITPPVTASILESITRDTIIDLAKKLKNVETIERDIDRTELYIADEVFLCGSAMEITPVLSVDGNSIGDSPGVITKMLRDIYFKVVEGQIAIYSKWLTEIY